MIGGYPHPGYLPARQVGHHATPGPRGQVIDGRAAAGRRGDGVKVDAVHHRRRRGVSPAGTALGSRDGTTGFPREEPARS